jgi:hypothetical protein
LEGSSIFYKNSKNLPAIRCLAIAIWQLAFALSNYGYIPNHLPGKLGKLNVIEGINRGGSQPMDQFFNSRSVLRIVLGTHVAEVLNPSPIRHSFNPIQTRPPDYDSGVYLMAGRPERTAKLLAQFCDDFCTLSERFNALCPAAYRKKPPGSWENAPYSDADDLWFLWHDAYDAVVELELSLMELSVALNQRAGGNGNSSEEPSSGQVVYSPDGERHEN